MDSWQLQREQERSSKLFDQKEKWKSEAASLAKLVETIPDLEQEIGLLRETLRGCQHGARLSREEVERLQSEIETWKGRAKQKRVDYLNQIASELQELKAENERLKAENLTLTDDVAGLMNESELLDNVEIYQKKAADMWQKWIAEKRRREKAEEQIQKARPWVEQRRQSMSDYCHDYGVELPELILINEWLENNPEVTNG